jgi:hypothetical protein
MYENSNLKTPFQELERKKKEKFSCRACRAEERIAKLENQLKKLEATAAATKNTAENRNESWAEVVKQAKEVKECTEKANAAERKVTELQTEMHRIQEIAGQRSTGLTTEQLRQAADEMSEIEKRKLNLIVSGFSEQGNDLEEFILFVNNGHDLPQSVEAKDIVAMERIG